MKLKIRMRLPRSRVAALITICILLVMMTGFTSPAFGDLAGQEINLAWGKNASASSVWKDNPAYAALGAIDGDSQSRWASAVAAGQWLQVDLGQPASFHKVVIKEYRSRIISYTVQVSNDGVAWNIVGSDSKSPGGADTTTNVELGAPVQGRYVKLLFDASEAASIYELEIIGNAAGVDAGVYANGKYRVSNKHQLYAAIQLVKAGETIEMTDGDWPDVNLSLTASATADKPVTLRARHPGKTVVKGNSRLSLNSPHLIIDGLKFAEGAPGDNKPVIAFNSDYGRVTNTAIVDYNPEKPSTGYYWVYFNGNHNRLDHSFFQGKNNAQPLIGNDGTNARYNRVDTSYIKDIPFVPNVNGREIFRIWGYGGNGETGDDGAFFTIERNLLEQADGEGAEYISLKSNNNVVRGNTIISTKGAIVARSGNYNTIEGNIILGNDIPGTKGIRITGSRLRVQGNYIANVERNAMTVMPGEHVWDERRQLDYLTPYFEPLARPGSPYGYVAHYDPVKDSTIARNVFVNNGGVDIDIGKWKYKDKWPQYQMVLLPENNTFAENMIYKRAGGTAIVTVVQDTYAPLDKFAFEPNRFERNIVIGADVDINPPSESKGVVVIGPNPAMTGELPNAAGEGRTTSGLQIADRKLTPRPPQPLSSEDVGPAWLARQP